MRRIVSTTQHIAIASLIAACALVGCRDPLAAPDDAFTPDAGEFDGGLEDDAGPGQACPADTPDLFNNAYSPYFGGDDNVDLEVVLYAYFRCPHCADFAFELHELWEDRPDFQERVRMYFHHYPFENETAYQVHSATVAAQNQGMDHFWAMHDAIYGAMLEEPASYLGVEDLRALAEQWGLDMDQWEADLVSQYTLDFLVWDKGQAQALGTTSTPSVFVCGEKISRSQLEEIIDGYLANLD